MSFKVVQGFNVNFETAAPKNGKNGPRVQKHSWSVSESDLDKVLSRLKSGITFPEDMGIQGVYQFKENMDLLDNPKVKERPEWAGMAIVNGKMYECFVMRGSSIVMLD